LSGRYWGGRGGANRLCVLVSIVERLEQCSSDAGKHGTTPQWGVKERWGFNQYIQFGGGKGNKSKGPCGRMIDVTGLPRNQKEHGRALKGQQCGQIGWRREIRPKGDLGKTGL